MARPYIHFLIAIPLYPTAQSKLPAALSRKAPIARNNLVLNVDIGLSEDEDQSTRVIPLDLGLHCFEKVFWQVGGALRLSNEYMRSFASWPFFSGTKKLMDGSGQGLRMMLGAPSTFVTSRIAVSRRLAGIERGVSQTSAARKPSSA